MNYNIGDILTYPNYHPINMKIITKSDNDFYEYYYFQRKRFSRLFSYNRYIINSDPVTQLYTDIFQDNVAARAASEEV